MSLTLQDIIDAARDADPAFAKQRVPDAVFARFLSRYQKRLVGKATEIRPGVISSQISIVFPPSPGLPAVSPVDSAGAGTGVGLPLQPTEGQNLALGSTGYSAVPEVVGNIAELDLTNAVTLFGPAVASATTTTTLTANGIPNWNPNQYADGQSYVQILVGSDTRDVRLIVANDTQTLTVNAPFVTQPDTTSIWRIIRANAVVNQEVSTVASLPSVSQRTGYAVKFDQNGSPYLDLTTPLTGIIAEGIPLPQFKMLLDGTVYFQTSLVVGEQDTVELTLVDATHRLRAAGRYNAYERNGQLFLIGNADDWGLVQSIDLRYVPEPDNLTALADTFVLPDSAYDALVAQAARFAAERLYNAQDTPNVDLDYYNASAAEAEVEWLQELGARFRANTSWVKEIW